MDSAKEYIWPNLPYIIQTDEGHPTFQEGTVFTEEDHSQFDMRVYSQLSFLPKFDKRLLLVNQPIQLKDRTTTGIAVKASDDVTTIVLTVPDENKNILLKEGNCYVVESDEFHPEKGEVLLTYKECKAMVPFNFWHETIEWGANVTLDPDDEIDYETYIKIHAPIEALADCLSFYLISRNMGFCASYSNLDVGETIKFPLKQVLSKRNIPKYTKYYSDLLDKVSDPSFNGLKGTFEKYINLAKKLLKST